tara:strand:- start:329 stop:565 length:237 start_codon:yes stop_codon:yes gene_type:complete
VPPQKCKKVNKIAICATTKTAMAHLVAHYYSLIPTLLDEKQPLCHCATVFFFVLKKNKCPKFSLIVAHTLFATFLPQN